jgi:uncharacterized membrane protein
MFCEKPGFDRDKTNCKTFTKCTHWSRCGGGGGGGGGVGGGGV